MTLIRHIIFGLLVASCLGTDGFGEHATARVQQRVPPAPRKRNVTLQSINENNEPEWNSLPAPKIEIKSRRPRPTEDVTSADDQGERGEDSGHPTDSPSEEPTISPSQQPSMSPSEEPTHLPSQEPSQQPSVSPTVLRTEEPSEKPTHTSPSPRSAKNRMADVVRKVKRKKDVSSQPKSKEAKKQKAGKKKKLKAGKQKAGKKKVHLREPKRNGSPKTNKVESARTKAAGKSQNKKRTKANRREGKVDEKKNPKTLKGKVNAGNTGPSKESPKLCLRLNEKETRPLKTDRSRRGKSRKRKASPKGSNGAEKGGATNPIDVKKIEKELNGKKTVAKVEEVENGLRSETYFRGEFIRLKKSLGVKEFSLKYGDTGTFEKYMDGIRRGDHSLNRKHDHDFIWTSDPEAEIAAAKYRVVRRRANTVEKTKGSVGEAKSDQKTTGAASPLMDKPVDDAENKSDHDVKKNDQDNKPESVLPKSNETEAGTKICRTRQGTQGWTD